MLYYYKGHVGLDALGVTFWATFESHYIHSCQSVVCGIQQYGSSRLSDINHTLQNCLVVPTSHMYPLCVSNRYSALTIALTIPTSTIGNRDVSRAWLKSLKPG